MTEIRGLKKEERGVLEEIIRNCNVFTENEIKVALELIDLNLAGSPDYIIEVLTKDEEIHGYVCYGENLMAQGIWDLYWICIKPESHGRGYGEILVRRVEEVARKKGGRSIFIETSSLPSYEKARKFYQKLGFKVVCVIDNYYKFGDHKIIYRKDILTF